MVWKIGLIIGCKNCGKLRFFFQTASKTDLHTVGEINVTLCGYYSIDLFV